MDQPKKLNHDVSAHLRRLAHDLSNSIETIMQASYLLAQTRLDAKGRKWAGMINAAANEAAHINREVRETLRSQNEKTYSRRRAS